MPGLNLFTDHPSSVDESYFEHMLASLGFAGSLFAAALAALVHANLPFLFVSTGSTIIRRLYEVMVSNRTRTRIPASSQAE